MKDRLLFSVRKFLASKLVPKKPVLLGYSGGPDSKALLYLFLDCRRSLPFALHLAHVDHGWRIESRREALELQKEAEKLGLPFHLKTCSKEDFYLGNWEEQGRNHRLQFFLELYRKEGCQALALGHQADDQAEVLLKRIFEGASLFSLGGLKEDRRLYGMNLWRPLLKIPKQQILDWLHQRGLPFFQDPTNLSPYNLRGKMRGEVLPLLCLLFGKTITSNLCHLGEESEQLKEYFSSLNQKILATSRKEASYSILDLTPFLPLSSVQLKYLLREWLADQKITFSRHIVESIVATLLKRGEDKKFMTRKGEVHIEKGVLIINKKERLLDEINFATF